MATTRHPTPSPVPPPRPLPHPPTQQTKTKQRRARALLAAKRLLVEEVDGADPACVEERGALWALSGVKAQYPQFFLEVRGCFFVVWLVGLFLSWCGMM